MKLRDLADRVIIDPRKLTEYALNPDNRRGRHKAAVFKASLGYSRDNYEALLTQIETKVWQVEAVVIEIDHHGEHVRADIEVVGIASQRATVRTGWLIPTGLREARLVTAYVRKGNV